MVQCHGKCRFSDLGRGTAGKNITRDARPHGAKNTAYLWNTREFIFGQLGRTQRVFERTARGALDIDHGLATIGGWHKPLRQQRHQRERTRKKSKGKKHGD